MEIRAIDQIIEVIKNNAQIFMWLGLSASVVILLDFLIKPGLSLLKITKKLTNEGKKFVYHLIVILMAMAMGYYNHEYGIMITHSTFMDCFLVGMGAIIIYELGWRKIKKTILNIPIIRGIFK